MSTVADLEQSSEERPSFVALRERLLHLDADELRQSLRSDQCERWQRGHRVRVEDYQSILSERADAADFIPDLVMNEVLLREEAGATTTAQEYLDRFPDWGSELGPRLAVHRALRSRGNRLEPPATSPTDLARASRSWPQIPGYELLAEFAHGGMGIIYLALQTGLRRVVALKMLRDGLPGHAESPARLRAEAEAVAQLRHPHIVQIFEIGEAAGHTFLVLEFLEGGNLSDRFGGRPVPPRLAAQLLYDLAGALEHAHDCGIIHRDLKPANILLTSDGVPKITDFGLAKHVGAGSSLTRDGDVVGTPSYMAPEQALGETNVGPAADLYGLGAILYELLTGRPPFRGATDLDTLQQVLAKEPVNPGRLQPGVPRDLETICLKCLEKQVGRRYVSAAELRADLHRFLEGSPISARPVSGFERIWRWCRRHPLPAGSLAAAGLLLLATLSILTAGLVAVDSARRKLQQTNEALTRSEERTQLALTAERSARKEENRRRRQARQYLDSMTSALMENVLARQPTLTKDQEQFLTQALHFYEEFAAETADDEQSRSGVAQAHLQMAIIRDRLGQPQHAERTYARAEELIQRLCSDFPDESRHMQNLARCRHNHGVFLLKGGRLAQAEAALRSAQGLIAHLVATEPAPPRLRCDLASVCNNLGTALQGLHRSKDAEQSYLLALDALVQLAAEDPRHVPYRHELARSHNNLGVLQQNGGEPAKAEVNHRAALRLRIALVGELPSSAEHKAELAGTYTNLGSLLAILGRMDEAMEHTRRALGHYEELADLYPGVPRYAAEAAATLVNLATQLQQQGKFPDAEKTYLLAIARLTPLAEKHSHVPVHREHLATANGNLAVLLSSQARHAEAIQRTQEAILLLESLIRDFPQVQPLRAHLQMRQAFLAEAQRRQAKAKSVDR
jgi:tetratricopeptide (TPR) repeat protein